MSLPAIEETECARVAVLANQASTALTSAPFVYRSVFAKSACPLQRTTSRTHA